MLVGILQWSGTPSGSRLRSPPDRRRDRVHLIAYATAPGRVARDGEGANGLYRASCSRPCRPRGSASRRCSSASASRGWTWKLLRAP